MKKGLIALVMAVLSLSVSAEQGHTPEAVAEELVALDQRQDQSEDLRRTREMTHMLGKAINQCRIAEGETINAGGATAMLLLARNELGNNGIRVSYYELLDMLVSFLGDDIGACDRVLTAYVAIRSSEDSPISHITAYKVLKALMAINNA